jgi:hypothetical protein
MWGCSIVRFTAVCGRLGAGRRIAARLLALLILLAPELVAQDTAELFRSPAASPTEPANLLRFVGEGRFDFGLAQPFDIFALHGAGLSWGFGLRPGFASRFSARGTQLLLQSADFRLGVPFAVRRGNWALRSEVYHLSSHRGADFDDERPAPRFSYSREAVQSLISCGRNEDWRVYGGPTVVLRTRPALERIAFQAGGEWLPRFLAGKHLRGYVAGDFDSRQESGWRVNSSVQTGVLLVNGKDQPLMRFAAWFYDGQTPFGQFFADRETIAGFWMTLELRPAIGPFIRRQK